MSTASTIQTIGQAVAAGCLRPGNLLLFRGRGLLALAIQVAGRSSYSHAGMVADWNGVPIALEATASGVVAVTLAERVREYSGRLDVFEANAREQRSDFQRDAAVEYMVRMTGRRYGYPTLARVALFHLPIVRWFIRPSFDDKAGHQSPEEAEPICSEAVALAYRVGGGVDPVPMLADRYTEPADLARSPFFRYRCTLVEGEAG